MFLKLCNWCYYGIYVNLSWEIDRYCNLEFISMGVIFPNLKLGRKKDLLSSHARGFLLPGNRSDLKNRVPVLIICGWLRKSFDTAFASIAFSVGGVDKLRILLLKSGLRFKSYFSSGLNRFSCSIWYSSLYII